jgi:Uma2 family endonuclease
MAALPTSPLVTVEEYLNTSYEPDVEYVDGILVERNVGDWLHSLIQSNLLFALRKKYPHLKVVAELRSRVTETRYRLPDITVLLSPPSTRYLAEAAYLVVEVLWESDEMSAVVEKFKEYAAKGVPHIWLIDPRLRTMSVYRPPVLVEIEGDAFATADDAIELTRGEIFAE